MGRRDIVRDGYNRVAADYSKTRGAESEDIKLLPELIERLPRGARVLDAGCGAGVPVTRLLAEKFETVGVDFSEEQIKLARHSVPEAEFFCRDLTKLDFPEASFDGICSYYAIIHIPRELHTALFVDFFRLLKPGGQALLCLGADDLESDYVEDYLGAPMFWSHFDAETNLKLLDNAGFTVIWSRRIADASCPSSGHLFVMGERPKSG